MTEFVANLPGWFHVLTLIVTAAAAAAALTPNPKDDEVVGTILKLINVIGFNWGGAKNAADQPVEDEDL